MSEKVSETLSEKKRTALLQSLLSFQLIQFLIADRQTFDDGDFGECTEKGVKEYQTDHKLEVDGIVGAQTFAEFWKK